MVEEKKVKFKYERFGTDNYYRCIGIEIGYNSLIGSSMIRSMLPVLGYR